MSDWQFFLAVFFAVVLFLNGPDGFDLHDALMYKIAGKPLP